MRSPTFKPFRTTALIILPRSDLNLTRFKITVATVDKGNFLRAGMQDARSRNKKLTAKWNLMLTLTYMPGLSAIPGLLKTKRTGTVRVVTST